MLTPAYIAYWHNMHAMHKLQAQSAGLLCCCQLHRHKVGALYACGISVVWLLTVTVVKQHDPALHLKLDALHEAGVVRLVQALILLLPLGIHHAAGGTPAGIEITLRTQTSAYVSSPCTTRVASDDVAERRWCSPSTFGCQHFTFHTQPGHQSMMQPASVSAMVKLKHTPGQGQDGAARCALCWSACVGVALVAP